jgi:hypothetical protein
MNAMQNLEVIYYYLQILLLKGLQREHLRKIDCNCCGCRRKQIPLRLGWASTIHKCQGMTIGKGEPYSYIIINPGIRSFESRNPGALFVALSRAKSAGNIVAPTDFAWHSSALVNDDRLCHKVNTPTVLARTQEFYDNHSNYNQSFFPLGQ